MPPLKRKPHAESDVYYLHMRPAERSIRDLPLGSEWYSEDPNEATYVSTARPVFAARMEAIRERLAMHGIIAEGPLISADADAAKKSQHDTWVLRVPHGKEQDANYATHSIGRIVGPIRQESAATLETSAPENAHTRNGHVNGKRNGMPLPILKRMREETVITETA